MKILGEVEGHEYVLNKDDGASALKMVDALPDAPGDDESHAVQLRIDSGDYKRGDIFVYENGAWRKVDVPTETVGSVSSIICPRAGCDVRIRWTDPEDRSPYTWKHTRLLRKYGEYPQSIYDGVIVTDSYIRNQYTSTMFHDYVPAGTEDGWYYRFYTFSEDEVAFSDDSCIFQPIELSWDTLNGIVQAGLATKVFALGDTVTLDVKDAYASDPFYKSLTFAVAGFNTASMEDLTKTYSITFVLTHTFGNYLTRWDKLWETYQLTTDTYVTNSSKVYYIKDADKGWAEVTNLPLGRKLEANTYYEKNTDTERQQHGGNKWANCTLRSWLNSTDESNEWEFTDEDGDTIKVVPPLVAFKANVANAITSVRNKNALPVGEDRASSDYAISVDKLYLLSMKEVFDQNAYYSWFQITSDSTPSNYALTEDTERNLKKNYYIYYDAYKTYRKAVSSDFNADGSFKTGTEYYELYYYVYEEASASYRLALADDYTAANEFKSDVTYYVKMISDIAENKYLPYFDDEDLEPRIIKDDNGAGTPRSWWLRSANILTTTKVRTVSAGGELQDGDHSYKTLTSDKMNHLVFAFTVA